MTEVAEDLAQKHCVPCEGDTPPLSSEEIATLKPQVPGWEVIDGQLTSDVQVKNFKQALQLINRVGETAEQEGHHPDMQIHGWNHVKFQLRTHAIDALSENDFILAAKISKLIEQLVNP